jgi:tungstate transport system substrate-binding protein
MMRWKPGHRAARVAVALALVIAMIGAVIGVSPAQAEERFITVASTTSTQNSGLFDKIVPSFAAASGIEVRVVAVGTGQAIRLAERGDADVLLVHHQPSEEKFVADGFGVRRFDVMYNDFVIVGPAADPAGIRGLKDAPAALARIAGAGQPFASRADDSGTHKLELALWQKAGVDVKAASGTWYRETGSGMGATLNTASALEAYAITDRGTWLSFNNKGTLANMVEGDKALFNQYGVILVNPARHAHVKAKDGQAFVDWLISASGQAAINAYTINGEPLFFANAGKHGS